MPDRRIAAPRRRAANAVALLLVLGAIPGLARAETSLDPAIRTDPLILSGTIESKPIDVSRTLRVRLIGNDDKQVTIRGTASDLARDGQPGQRPLQIPATSISVDERSAKPGQAVDLPVSVKGIASPGVYRGTLALALDNSPAAATTVKLELHAGVKPVVDVLDKSVTVSVSNCSGECGFTELAAPGSTKAGTSHIAVLNRSPAVLAVFATVDAKGGNLPLLDADRIVGSPAGSDGKLVPTPIEPGKVGRVPLTIRRESLAPDRYTGNVLLVAAADKLASNAAVAGDGTLGVENQTFATVPLTVDVRAAALWPFLVVLLGVAVGRFMTALTQKNREARVALYAQYTFLADRIRQLDNQAWRNHCLRKLDDLWARALAGDPADAKLRQEFSSLAAANDLFWKLQKLDQEVDSLVTDPATKTNIQKDIAAAGDALMKGDFTAAEKSLADATDKINAASRASGPAAAGAAPGGYLATLADDAKADASWQKTTAARQRSKPRRAFATVLQFFSGIDTTETIALQYWFVQPLMHILLLLVLAFYGLWLLYSGPEHSTFGAKGFAEWLGLFLWGFGAQVVALSFRDISFTSKPKS